MEALINEYRLEIIEHCWKYSNSHSSFINWILKFRKFLILAPAPSIFSGVSRKGRKVCHSFKCFKIGVLHIRSWSTFSIFLISEMAGVTMTLFCTHGRVSGPNSLLDHEVIAPCGYSVPCQFWPVVRRHGRGVLWAGGDPCMTGCLECPLASPVFAQSWSQTATDGAWYSTTALLSGRDRPRCLCVLRLSGSEPESRRTGA